MITGFFSTTMNILVLNWQDLHNPHAGGAETHLFEIFSRIANQGHSVTLYCSSFPGSAKEEYIQGIRVLREGNRQMFNFSVPRRYLQQFRHEPFDIVIDDLNKIPFFTPLYVQKPLLVLAHHLFGLSAFAEVGMMGGSYVFAAEWLLNLVYRKSAFSVVSESTLQEFVERGFPRQNFSVIHNAINSSQFPFTTGKKYQTPTIAYCGRLKRYKSVDHILHAFAIVLRTIPDAQLLILGKGDAEQYLRDLAATLHITNSVTFYGFVPEEEKTKMLSAVHCLINPSMKEGWGIINIEANACGTPVLSADVPGLRDSVRHGQSGLLYEYGNIAQLAENITLILQNHELRDTLSRGAIFFARQFDWDVSAHQMVLRMEEVITSFYRTSTLATIPEYQNI